MSDYLAVPWHLLNLVIEAVTSCRLMQIILHGSRLCLDNGLSAEGETMTLLQISCAASRRALSGSRSVGADRVYLKYALRRIQSGGGNPRLM